MIGLETHVQLNTDSKLFCGCPNRSTDQPNTHVCETCLGHPGSKPRTNEKAVKYALRAALALNCEIAEKLVFSRKTYFYPDMSKNFQITQYKQPLGEHGEIELDGETIRIKRLHIEEDPAKIQHIGGSINDADYTLLDYNRAGSPLIEIVTEPDMSTPRQARTYLQKLSRILEYLGVYDSAAELALKTDANISLDGGARVEIKNITGAKNIQRALQYEITRQKNLAKRGRKVVQETRAYHDDQQVTMPLRTKEAEAEYGYIFEPDIPITVIRKKQVDTIQKELPELPDAKKTRFVEEYSVSEKVAEALVSDKALADAFERVAEELGDTDLAASWFAGPIKKALNYVNQRFEESTLTVENVLTVLRKLEHNEITDQAAEKVVQDVIATGEDPETIIAEADLGEIKADEVVVNTVENVLDNNADAVQDYRNGEEKALNFLVGKVMEKSRGRIDPNRAREELLKRLT